MTFKIPRLCTAITVSGNATLHMAAGLGPAFDTDPIDEREYWGDPVYDGMTLADDAICLGTRILKLIEDGGGSPIGTQVEFTDFDANLLVKYLAIEPDWDVIFDFTDAGSTAPAKIAMARLGADVLGSAETWTVDGFKSLQRMGSCNWSPGYSESFDLDLRPHGFGVVNHAHSGKAYGLNLGDPIQRRTITLRGINGDRIKMRATMHDQSFERCVWMPAQAGEKVRYWRDINASNTYLTAAMTAAQRTAVLKSVTGFSVGENACIDGEIAYIEAINTGTKTLTLFRPAPVAHIKYAPVSDDFVGTYVLSQANMRDIDDERRGPEQDRWDLDLTLEATA